MLELINKCQKYLLNRKDIELNHKKTQEVIKLIKNEQLITITWLKSIGKTSTISYIVTNSNYKDSYLYINKDLDLNNKLKNSKSLYSYLDTYIYNYSEPKIIILENVALINNIKEFINYLYKNKYKIVVIWNNIQIWKKPEIEIEQNRKDSFNIIEQDQFLLQKLKTKEIIFDEIIKIYSLKNFELYNYTISFIGKINIFSSLRELNRNLNEIIKVSLVTMMDYIVYSKKAKIINQIYSYDFKKQKEITTKTKYYFTDINLRNSLQDFNIPLSILKENFLYNELKKEWYKINSWINWSYNFDFYITKEEQKQDKIKYSSIFIDFCKSKDKQEIKKQINKLLKVPEKIIISDKQNIEQLFSKYLIIENPSDFWIKKLQYDNLKIVSLNELLNKF